MKTKSSGAMEQKRFKVVPIMVTLLLGGFISLLNETILNVAFPQIMADFHITAGVVQWLATAYMLVIGILVPITAFLIHSFTTRTLYNCALILFTAGSVGAGLSESFALLLIARIVQGLGTGMLVPIMMDTILVINPPEKRGAALGLGLFVILVAPAVGPAMAGLVLTWFSWNGIFFCMVPLAMIAIILGNIYLENASIITRPKIDIFSIILSILGFGGVIYGISTTQSAGLTSIEVLCPLGIGLLALVLFYRRQMRLKQPMLQVSVFKYPMFSIGVALIMINMMIWFSLNIILPTFMQDGLLVSSFAAGLALLPGGLINGVFSPFTGRLYDRIGAKILLLAGFLCLGVALVALRFSTIDTDLIFIVILHCCFCLGSACIMAPAQTNSLNQLPLKYSADGIAIINTSLQIAAAIGSSLFVNLLETGYRGYLAEADAQSAMMKTRLACLSGLKLALTAAVGFTILGLILAFFVRSGRFKEQI